jgi:general secretion pathway protein L
LLTRIVPARSEFVIDLGRDVAVVSTRENGHLRLVGQIERDDRFPAAVGNVAGIFRAAHALVVDVRLSRAMILRRELEMPKSAEVRLRQIIALDLDRQTPFTADDAVFDVRVRERNTQSDGIQVSLVVARRETIEAALDLCRALGVSPRSIAIENPIEQTSEFNLLPSSAGRAATPIWKRPAMMMAIGAALLIAINIGLAYRRLDVRLTGLSVELTKARRDAQGAEKLREQLTRAQSANRLLSEAGAQADPLDVLKELTHLFPDDVWLFQLEAGNGVAQIAGFAPSASEIIERLDKSPLFANPKFRGSVTRAERIGKDRFEISVDLRRLEPK